MLILDILLGWWCVGRVARRGEGVGLKLTAEVMGLTEDGSKITEQPRGKLEKV